MGINVGNLNASLTLQSAQFMASMKAAAQQSQQTSLAINKAMGFAKGAVIGLAGAFSVDMFSHVVKGAFDFADAIQDLSDRTGASTKFIQEFGYAAQISGSSVENARTGIEKFAKNMGEAANGNKEMRATLIDLGVSLSTIAKGDTDTAIKNVADGISKIDNKAAQAADTVKLFGKSGQDLVATLAGGSAGLSDFARKAAELGIVIDSKLIASAGKVNDKLDTIKMIMDAQMASMIVKNADAIVSLADGVTSLVGSLVKFWSQNPQAAMTVMGALAGGAVGGLPGAAVGGIGGYLAGTKMKQAMSDGNMDVGYRKTQLMKSREDLRTAKDSAPGLVDSARSEFGKQWGLFQKAVVADRMAKRAPPKPDAKGNGYLAPLAGSNAKKDNSAKEDEAATKTFNDALFGGQIEALRQRADLKPNAVDRSAIERQINEMQFDRGNSDIDSDLAEGKFGKGDLAKARADQLKAVNDQNFMLAADLINRKENESLKREDLDAAKATLANDNDVASGSLNLARTQAERRSIQLRMLDKQYEQDRLEQEANLASHESTDAQKKIAEARLKVLNTLKGQDQQSVLRQTMGPGASFLDSMPASLGEIQESLESVAVEGFGRLNDGIADALTGTGSLASAFGNMAKSIIADLARIAIQQAVIKPLAGALFGSSGGGGGGLFGKLLGTVGGALAGSAIPGLAAGTTSALNSVNSSMSLSSLGITGWRANGGYTAPGSYMVGERGPEMISVGQPSSVVTTRELRGMGANDNQRGAIHVTVNGVNDPAMVKRLATEAIVQALPATTQISSAVTMQRASYPRMR